MTALPFRDKRSFARLRLMPVPPPTAVAVGGGPQPSTIQVSARTLLSLSASECFALMLAIPLVITSRVVLWLLPSNAIVGAVRRMSRSRQPAAASSDQWVVPMWAVSAVSRRVPGATCLTQAIAGLLLLRVYGLSAKLCLGVGFDGSGEFRAHAWLESIEGRILIGRSGVHSLQRLPI